MKLSDGTVIRAASERLPRPGHESDPLPILPPPGPEAQVVDGVLVAKSLTGKGRTPIPILGDRQKFIFQPDAWAAIPYDPKLVEGQPLTISNCSGGRYGISVQAEDCSNVRLNGGLVVPGRFYLLDGTITIQSTVPVEALIRPLDTLHGYYELPLIPPSANG